jgi:lipoprotein-anchoring transpeptidase ErfK/SrfK
MHFSRLLLCTLVMTYVSNTYALEVVVDLGHKPHIRVMDKDTTLSTYPIVAPKSTPSCVYTTNVYGTVTTIERDAVWRPTERTKESRRKQGVLLKDAYAPHERGNALAGRRMRINWHNTCINPSVHIHGTHEPSLVTEQARASRGCFRMRNEDWDILVRTVTIGTQVRVTAGSLP